MEPQATTESQSIVKPERVLELLTEQRDLYIRLRELSGRQRSVVSGDEPEAVLEILSERQKLVVRLAALNAELTPFRRDWQGVCERLPAESRQTASALVEEINAMLRFILQADQEDGALLAARRQGIARSLGQMSDSRTAHAAYARAAQGNGGGSDLSA